MNKLQSQASCLLFCGTIAFSATAQDVRPYVALSQPLPAAVEAVIKGTTATGVFPVGQLEKFGGQVIKADVVNFSPNSVLEFTNTNQRWVAIVAKVVQFANNDFTSNIVFTRPVVAAKPGKQASLAAPPQNSRGACGVVGPVGTAGQNGLVGVSGASGADLPTLYIIADRIRVQSGPTDRLKLRVGAVGVNGQDGGDGQDGQPGGNGGPGGHGRWNSASWQYPGGNCTCSAGSGGAGGPGGLGSQRGAGGGGSDGGSVYYGGTPAALNMLTFTVVENQWGIAGQHGAPGVNAPGGIQGERGSHPGRCGGGNDSSPGVPASTFAHPPLSPALIGRKGTVDIVNTTAALLW